MPLWPAHWEEVGRDKERLKLDPDIELMDAIANIGRLHIVTVRSEGALVGYHASIIEPMPSYKTIACSQGHVYFIAKFHRGPRVFMRLLQEVERSCKARGVQVLFDRTKNLPGLRKLYEWLGFKPADLIMMKWIGDP